jgi:baseplate J-like protein
MKTQIITLESHDDLISVRDRMSWAKTPRILLVWPKYEKVALRQVDLKVLQRHALSLGAQLGLVTRTRRVRADAEALKIPVFESTGQAQRLAWPKPRRRRLTHHTPPKDLRAQRDLLSPPMERAAWQAHPITRVSEFILGVSSVLVLVALFIPRVQIILQPKSKIQSIVLPVAASPSVDSVFITGNIPAHEKRVIVDGSQTVVVTGTGVTPQSKSKGNVIFRNLTQQSVTVPVGTVIKTVDNIRFVTTDTSEVEAGAGKMLELPIEAMEAGLSGNVDAETIKVVEGRLGLSLSVTNPEATTGGRETPSVQASDGDRERAKDQLMKSLESQARAQLAGEMRSGDVLLEDTFSLSQILSEIYEPPAGAAGTKLTLTMQVEFSSLYASAQDLTELASLALNASLPSGFQAPAGPEALTVRSATNPTAKADGSIHWTIRAERRIIRQINNAQVTQLIQGIRSQRVQSVLEKNLPLDTAPQVELSPSWWPWVPIVPFRISVVTE